MKRDLDRGEEASENVIQRTTQGTQRRTYCTQDGGQAFSEGKVEQVCYKVGPQCVTPIEFAPRVCSSPMHSSIKHMTCDSSASLDMENKPVSPERSVQNDTGNLNRSQMLMNFGPEVTNAKERGVFRCSSERVGCSKLTEDSLRKRRLADLSDPDLQIITSRQRNMDSDFQVKSFQILTR